MAGRTIVLAHGVLGFGNLLPGVPTFVNYFKGVAEHLGRNGHTVLAPQVNPFGSVSERGDQLGAFILRQTPAGRQIHIIAHSMGGLDARHAIAHVPGVADLVVTLVTIGTPHRGSPVADAIARRSDPLFGHIPTFVVEQLKENVGALHDLTTTFGAQFDDATPDASKVRYIEVAGDASKGSHELFLFQLAALIGRLTGEVNDGVVTRASALRSGHKHLEDWPVDHAGEVGWEFDSLPPIAVKLPFGQPSAHLSRFDKIVDLLVDRAD